MARKPTKKLGKFLIALKQISENAPHDVARWNRDGTQFDVVDPVAFDSILVQHFPNAHPKTFFRQLSHYKITKLNVLNGGGNDRIPGSFSLRHAKFQRNAPDLIFEIECRNRKRCGGGGSRSPPSTPTSSAAAMAVDEENVRVDEYCAKQELEHGMAVFRHNLGELMRSVADLLQDPRYQAFLSNNV